MRQNKNPIVHIKLLRILQADTINICINLRSWFVKKDVFVILSLLKASTLLAAQSACLQFGAWMFSLMSTCFSFTKSFEVEETSGRDDWMNEQRPLFCLCLKWLTDGSKPGTSTSAGIHGIRTVLNIYLPYQLKHFCFYLLLFIFNNKGKIYNTIYVLFR